MDALVIAGPTAVGKTELALSLAKQMPIEIINMDSALVYRGLDIGTAKPSLQERQRVPHHLIDIIEPHQSYSAADFVNAVETLIPVIQQRGALPVIVGGTMLYYHSWIEGLSVLPASDPAVRERLSLRWQSDPEALYQQLVALDPTAASRIHFNDQQRILRALEVIELAGVSMSEQQAHRFPTNYKVKSVFLMPEDRSWLHRRIEQRFEQMLSDGFLEEVKQLMTNSRLHSDLPSMRSVGYRQVWSFWSGEIDFQQMLEQSLSATRGLAKRQLTWMRRMQSTLVIHPDKDQDISEKLQALW